MFHEVENHTFTSFFTLLFLGKRGSPPGFIETTTDYSIQVLTTVQLKQILRPRKDRLIQNKTEIETTAKQLKQHLQTSSLQNFISSILQVPTCKGSILALGRLGIATCSTIVIVFISKLSATVLLVSSPVPAGFGLGEKSVHPCRVLSSF
jgi:hypothetical protein